MSEAGPVPNARSFYRPELDILRFLAFLAVFFAHLLPNEIWSPQGQIAGLRSGIAFRFYTSHHISAFGAKLLIAAVGSNTASLNIFFVLSAFLISTLLLRERELSGTLNLRAFYVRRILRIWPLYFLAIAIGTLWRFIDFSSHLERRYLIAYLLLAGNWPFVFYGATSSFMAPLWSVSVEEQFYLAWPLILRRLTMRGMLAFSVGMLGAGILGVWFLTARGYPWPEKSTFFQLPSIAVGIVLACIRPLSLSVARRILVFLIGAGVVFASSWAFQFHGINFSLIPILDAMGAGLIFVSFLGSSLRNRQLCYLGKISYGLYVYHEFCIYLVKKAHLGHGTTVFRYLDYGLLALLLTLAISALSYRFIETPFLRLKDRFAVVHSRPV
jgi:peptidoglycan/LPS O-acetylase OafA/YrhL